MKPEYHGNFLHSMTSQVKLIRRRAQAAIDAGDFVGSSSDVYKFV
jgi:hypothetical protein